MTSNEHSETSQERKAQQSAPRASITPAELREQLERDLPGAAAPRPAPPAEEKEAAPAEGGEGEKKAPKAGGKGKDARPDFLTTEDVVVLAERLPEVAAYVRDTMGYTYLSDIAVVDYLQDGLFELVYRFYHLDGGGDLVIKVRVPRDTPEVPALTPIWPGANFHEREGYDLFGIQFTGHPDLRRLYMWDEFVGHPMRKDFPKQGDKYMGK